jgi:hypothetical protein
MWAFSGSTWTVINPAKVGVESLPKSFFQIGHDPAECLSVANNFPL